MVRRIFNPLLSRSFFVFGARGVGKTSWLQQQFTPQETFWIDLLDEDLFERSIQAVCAYRTVVVVAA